MKPTVTPYFHATVRQLLHEISHGRKSEDLELNTDSIVDSSVFLTD